MDGRTQKCPRCGKEVSRYKSAVPGRDVVFEYFLCDDGMFTAVWNRSDWSNNTLPDKPFISVGYVVDEPAHPLPAPTGEDGGE